MSSMKLWINNSNEFVLSEKHREGLTRPKMEMRGNKLVHRERDSQMRTIFREVPKKLRDQLLNA